MTIRVLRNLLSVVPAGVINFVSSASSTSTTTTTTTTTTTSTTSTSTTTTTTISTTTALTSTWAPLDGCCLDCFCTPPMIAGPIEVMCREAFYWNALGEAVTKHGCRGTTLPVPPGPNGGRIGGNCYYGADSGKFCALYTNKRWYGGQIGKLGEFLAYSCVVDIEPTLWYPTSKYQGTTISHLYISDDCKYRW